MTISVVLADDQAMVRAGLRMILEAEDDLEVVGEASDGEEALAVTRQHQPDVVLMDIQMPKMDGLEATRRVGQEAGVRSRVVVLTTFERDDYVFEALRAGASGFLLKNAPPEELVHAVRIVAAGDALLAPSITRRVIAEYAQRPAPPSTIPASIGSPNARPKCYGYWPPARATPSSPPSSTWAKGPSKPTSPTCSPSSAYATESRPSSSPTKAASSNPANPDGRPSRRSSGLRCQDRCPAITRDM
jgi:DNA-binding NarL/FixJ family response regulator